MTNGLRHAWTAPSGRSNPDKPLPRSLRDIRHARGLTITDVSSITGLHKARISELERGERNPRTTELDALASAYNVHGWRVITLVVEDTP